MKYRETTAYLYGLQQHGMKFGLDNITKLLSGVGNPQKTFRAVHVGGTNGKGSTAAMIESILRTSGVRTGLFTSPHIVNFTERIRVDGEEIGEEDVIALAEEVRQVAERMAEFSPTFFEVVTAMAFLHFERRGVGWAVIEVGLGGRLDATNVLVPEAAVITTIGYDHCEFLGKTLKEIAGEKAGIIKNGVPVVSAEQRTEAAEVIEKKAAEKRCRLFRYEEEFTAQLLARSPMDLCFHYTGAGDYKDIQLPLAGVHQMGNAAMAIKTIEVLSEKYPELQCDIGKGLAAVRWPGRLEMARNDPPILIDGAHNPHAALALSHYLQEVLANRYQRIILVAGIMADKDISGILDPLLALASEVIFASPAYGRAAQADVLTARAAAGGYSSRAAGSVAEALLVAEGLWRPGDLIVVTGSFYTIGEAKEALGTKGVLTRLRE
jgi:dihydrofolate synthase/folylpolyglutamate synthase